MRLKGTGGILRSINKWIDCATVDETFSIQQRPRRKEQTSHAKGRIRPRTVEVESTWCCNSHTRMVNWPLPTERVPVPSRTLPPSSFLLRDGCSCLHAAPCSAETHLLLRRLEQRGRRAKLAPTGQRSIEIETKREPKKRRAALTMEPREASYFINNPFATSVATSIATSVRAQHTVAVQFRDLH